MNILIINAISRESKIITSDFVPSKGDKIDMFYEPLPAVSQVIAWPSRERLEAIGINEAGIDAIITAS